MTPPVQDAGSTLPRTGHLILWSAWIPIAAALLVSTANSFTSLAGFQSLLLGAFIVCGWGIAMVVAAGLAARRRSWRRMASLLTILVCAGPAIGVSMIAGDYIHLLLALPYYEAKIAESGADSKPIYFHWPSAGLVPSYERNLVYDSSDELATHAGRSEPLESEPAVAKTVRHLAGHFYLVELSW